MSLKKYYEQMNSQTGIKAYIKKRVFDNLLKELIRQEKEIEKQKGSLKELKREAADKEKNYKRDIELLKNEAKQLKQELTKVKAESAAKIAEQNNVIFRELIKIASSESRTEILLDWYFQMTGESIDLRNNHHEQSDIILLVEFNRFHGECIPGFYKYLSELNYDVDCLVSDSVYKENALAAVECRNVFHCNIELMALLLQYVLLDRYKIVIFNSNAFLWEERKRGKWFTVLQEFPFLRNYLDKIYVLEHQLEFLDKTLLEIGHVFVLTDKLPLDKRLIPVNCHWFGERYLPPKNNVTRFISVGAIAAFRKNFDLLLKTVEDLYDKGIRNFHVTIVGRGTLEHINAKLQPFISVLGRVSYSDVCSEMNKSDYLLTLLDPDNPDHDRYITIGTSGSFQLIYGFSKPCLIAEKFADVYGFSSENAIVYRENKELGEAMIKAIEMKEDEYEAIRNNLIKVSDDIYNQSLANLKRVLVDKKL